MSLYLTGTQVTLQRVKLSSLSLIRRNFAIFTHLVRNLLLQKFHRSLRFCSIDSRGWNSHNVTCVNDEFEDTFWCLICESLVFRRPKRGFQLIWWWSGRKTTRAGDVHVKKQNAVASVTEKLKKRQRRFQVTLLRGIDRFSRRNRAFHSHGNVQLARVGV